MAKNEPQSYGGQGEWLTGKTGETVNGTKGHPTTQHRDFYESRVEGEESRGDQGGKVSDAQLAENSQADPVCATEADEEQPVQRVTGARGGARRDSEFKRRDYE